MKHSPALKTTLFATTLALCGAANALDFPSAGRGTVELTVVPKTGNFAFGKNAVLFRASSEDGTELYEIHVNAEDLIVMRDYGRCIRSADRTPHNFKQGMPRKLKLAWNGATTRFYLDGAEIEGFNQMVVDEFSWPQPFVTVNQTGDFMVRGVLLSPESAVAQDPADAQFALDNPCPNLSELFKTKPQETHRGITLNNFPDQKSRDIIKGDIDLLTPGMAAALKRVILVEKGRYPADYWRGRAYQGIATMLLLPIALEDPSTFFHEAAHLYDYAAFAASGNYLSKAWQSRLMDPAQAKAASAQAWQTTVLAQMDGSSASEELADFAGHAYDFYLKGGAPAGYLSDKRNRTGLDFLLKSGVISEAVYRKLNPAGEK